MAGFCSRKVRRWFFASFFQMLETGACGQIAPQNESSGRSVARVRVGFSAMETFLPSLPSVRIDWAGSQVEVGFTTRWAMPFTRTVGLPSASNSLGELPA